MGMGWRVLADAVLVLHLAVILFIALGGFLARRWPWLARVHLPFVAWGVAIELVQWTCPLTPLENVLRRRAGEGGFEGGFIEHYLVRAIYPEGLGPVTALLLAAIVITLNALAYAPMVARRRARAGG
jgi:hypothetical protein